MEDSAVDLVVENLLELLDTDDKLIVKAYEEKRIDKEQIEWFYEEMQSMRKFLKDSDQDKRNEDEKVKDVVKKIRDVTAEVDDIVDSIILSAHFQTHMLLDLERYRIRDEEITRVFCLFPVKKKILKSLTHMAMKNHPGFIPSLEHGGLSEHFKCVAEHIFSGGKKICDLVQTSKEDIDSIRRSREEMIAIFRRLCDSANGPYNFTKEIMSTEREVKNKFPHFSLNYHLYSLSRDVSNVLMKGSRVAWPAFCVPDDCLPLSHMLKMMVSEAVREIGCFRVATKKIKSIQRTVKKVSDKFKYSDIAEVIRLCVEMVDQADKIHRGYGTLVPEIMCFAREVMKIYERGLSISWLGSLTANKISSRVGSVIEEIKSIKTEVVDIYDKKMYGTGVLQIGESSQGPSTRAPRPIVDDEIVVGFDDQKRILRDLLTRDHEKQLKVISVHGMPGLGKTTLAKEIYNDSFIVEYFTIRAWTYVSQVYRKRDLLLGILCSDFHFPNDICKLSDEKLGEVLYKHLKGNRYLIVMDDIWNIEAWDDFRRYFSDDNNGSRIMFTSRVLDVAVALHSTSHRLRFLNGDESWELFRQRVFQKENCPAELMEIGKQIATKCQGLPLAIVVIAGLLKKKDKTLEWWRHVAKSVSSYIVSDRGQYMDTLALSYNHLPCHLKPCYLYFSAFPEDYEIPVQKVVSLWIAEGFIHQIEDKILEDVAEDYLMDLIDRSLVLAVGRKSTGGIKACRVHDLLHDLCLRKAKEENFLQQIYWYEEVSSSSCTANKQLFLPIAAKQHRLCVRSRILDDISSEFSAQHIRSFLYFGSEMNSIPPKDMSFIERGFHLLRVLDLSSINVSNFSYSITHLVLLRYLAIKGKILELPSNIYEFQNLETLIVSGQLNYLPTDVWKMVKLRHLRIGGKNFIPNSVGDRMDRYPPVLDGLQTISQVCPSKGCQKILTRTPNLRKLVLCGSFKSDRGWFWFPDLDLLNHLQMLKLLNRGIPDHHRYNLQGVKFPPNLKRLTLSNTGLEWKEMSILGSLPNLESLKLECQACIGPQWDTSDGGFCRLKFLRFDYINIEQWNASSYDFPVLERLVLHRCRKLKEIPFELGDIDTLQMIEVSSCSDSAINSARQILEEQQGSGNDFLKILIINPLDWEFTV